MRLLTDYFKLKINYLVIFLYKILNNNFIFNYIENEYKFLLINKLKLYIEILKKFELLKYILFIIKI